MTVKSRIEKLEKVKQTAPDGIVRIWVCWGEDDVYTRTEGGQVVERLTAAEFAALPGAVVIGWEE